MGEIGGRGVGFIPRHGRSHELPIQRINHRANLWALSELGATDVILPCAAGMRQAAIDCARDQDIPVHDHGTIVVIEGPRFSTRAESQFYSPWAGRSST